ncbi:hypothetical protein AC578_3946 [Pseudocercospora eumusae]|uniref:Uncharacterized protein n=1 Tax=Pseudocercospora eumusae TaxID=321146 RepID=A0A139HLS9_9PEZI|nr:hypothetical protein AC578_3946 [Pseudocercospora eumusae]
MPSDKDRLYIALYAQGGQPRMPGLEDKYHWAIVVFPKGQEPDSKGTMFHVRDRVTKVDDRSQSSWQFEERSTTMELTSMLLVRVLVGKVANLERMKSVLRSTDIKATQPDWNCVFWVKEALQGLEKNGKALGRSKVDWVSVRDAAMQYVERKKLQHRFDGQGNFDVSKVATWDLIEGREVVP